MGTEKKTKVQTFQWHSISWSPPFESTTQALKNALFLFKVQFSVKPDGFPGEILIIRVMTNVWKNNFFIVNYLVKLSSFSLVYL